MSASRPRPRLPEPPSQTDAQLAEITAALRHRPRRLSSKYFYDAPGSALFERICEQPEYYLTRVELAIMRAHGLEMCACLGPRVMLVEYGSGSGQKTRLLLRALSDPVAYVPVEVSHAPLVASARALAEEFPSLEVLPLCADFTAEPTLPAPRRAPLRRAVYFPGSTIGNFNVHEAQLLLRQIRATVGDEGGALIGIDLKKDPAILEAAYNDAAGVTAAFTLNMLARFNRELDANFDLTRFRHRARYNALAGRIETFLVSEADQKVRLGAETFHFERGEAMLVEYSCKYTLEEFAHLARGADLRIARSWTDEDGLFAVLYLVGA